MSYTSIDDIAAVYAQSGTVEIYTTQDYYWFMRYLMQNPQQNTGADSTGYRRANIKADLDFSENQSHFVTYTSGVAYLWINGEGHKISNIEYTQSGDAYLFGRASTSSYGLKIENLTVEDCLFDTKGSIYVVQANTMINIIVRDCTMTAQVYYCFSGVGGLTQKWENLGSANIVYPMYQYRAAHNLGSHYTGQLYNAVFAKRIVILDTVYGTKVSQDTSFYAFYTCVAEQSFSRNKFIALPALGINLYGMYLGGAYTSYIAFEFENCENWINAMGTNKRIRPYYNPTSGYTYTSTLYDKTLISAAGIPDDNIDATYGEGVETNILQSKDALTKRGWVVYDGSN